MYRSIEDFLKDWEHNAEGTAKLLDAMTDASLAQPVAEGHRTLGRIAWHLAQTIPEMLSRTGLSPAGPGEEDSVPATAAEIASAYREASRSLAQQVREQWTDDSLEVEDDMYGMRWKRGLTLRGLLMHESHHRGQMTVLMRQAGLQVPGLFGPAKEEWAAYGMEPPAV